MLTCPQETFRKRNNKNKKLSTWDQALCPPPKFAAPVAYVAHGWGFLRSRAGRAVETSGTATALTDRSSTKQEGSPWGSPWSKWLFLYKTKHQKKTDSIQISWGSKRWRKWCITMYACMSFSRIMHNDAKNFSRIWQGRLGKWQPVFMASRLVRAWVRAFQMSRCV